MLQLVVLMIVVAALPSTGHIWEKPNNRVKDFHERYQTVPPDRVTARKLMHYFLSRPDWSGATLNGRTKRQATPDQDVMFDVAFIIDGSGSLSKRAFTNGLEALALLIPRARPTTKYAAITFADKAETNFGFTDKNQAMMLIQNTTQKGGLTNTQEALDRATELFLNETSGVRQNTFKRVLIVTDGQSNVHKDRTLYNAYVLKSLGVEVFVVAVGKYIEGIVEIVGMCSSSDAHLYRVDDLDGLLRVVRLIPEWRYIKDFNRKSWLSNMYSGTH